MRPILFAIGYYVVATIIIVCLSAALGPGYGHSPGPMVYVIGFLAFGGVVLAAIDAVCFLLKKRYSRGALLVHALVLGAFFLAVRS